MRRTGSPYSQRLIAGARRWAVVVALCAAGIAAADKTDFYQTVDRNEVGTDDTFSLTVVISSGRNGQLALPQSPSFEILSRSQSQQTSFDMNSGSVKQTHKFTLLMRANHPGKLTLPPSQLTIDGQVLKTDSIVITVRPGHVAGPRQRQQQQPNPMDPFAQLNRMLGGGNPFDGDDQGFPEPEVPRSNSDLFLKAYVDHDNVYVGEQVTLTLAIYSRVDLTEVASLNMPKLDGFWSEDIDSPQQLSGQTKVVNGIPYRVYLLKRLALFPVKTGKLVVSAADVDVMTGLLFSSQTVHRASSELPITVKPLPVANKPVGFPSNNVGSWRASAEATQTQVELGQPVTLRVTLEGRGNLKNVTLPPVTGPSGLRIYDPTTTDKTAVNKGVFGGRRVQEYLVLPQQTGRFTLPPLNFEYFDPQTERYEISQTDPIALTVVPGSGGSPTGPKVAQPELGAKNVLAAGGLRPLRYQASFAPAAAPLWQRPFFIPTVLAPMGLWMALGLVGAARSRLSREDEGTLKRRKARASRKRLAGAERLQKAADGKLFYAEVEKALLGFLEAKLGVPVGGLTRDKLTDALRASAVPENRERQVLGVLEQCDLGRFAPGAVTQGGEKLLDAAEAVMEHWDDAPPRGAA